MNDIEAQLHRHLQEAPAADHGGRCFSGSGLEVPLVQLPGCFLSPDARILRRAAPPSWTIRSLPAAAALPPLRVPAPLARRPIRRLFPTGIRAIDAFTTAGRGQRLALLALPGVGKSRLSAAIAVGTTSQVCIIALIGERGREVQEFVDAALPAAAWPRTVVIASTSDQSAALRILAAQTAVRIAAGFRNLGMHVLLQIDSLTRLARAYREQALADGEPPVRRGYPASVFEKLPRLLEPAGEWHCGSITAFYTLLLSDELDEDPIAEEVKSLVDGHILLDRSAAERGRFPAVDICRSHSRLQDRLIPKEALHAVASIRSLADRLRRDRDLLAFGGSADAQLQAALLLEPQLEEFLRQAEGSGSSLQETFSKIERLYYCISRTTEADSVEPLGGDPAVA